MCRPLCLALAALLITVGLAGCEWTSGGYHCWTEPNPTQPSGTETFCVPASAYV